jgi:hypothetical protein
MLKAKTVMPNKFWILENNAGVRQGTLSIQNKKAKVVLDNVEKTYEDVNQACWDLAINLDNESPTEVKEEKEDAVLGYPTKCAAFNPIWDIKRKIPVFTKTAKSKTLHAAGYYIVEFETGWVPSFCPKVSTLDSNQFQGPYKDKLEMRAQLRKAVNDSDFD